MANILIVDDDLDVVDMFGLHAQRLGHSVDPAHTLEEGFRLAKSKPFDVIYLDVGMPDGNGIQALPRFKKKPSQPEVIIITGVGDPKGAELAIIHGAWDYVEKGASVKELLLPLNRALDYRQEKKATRPTRALKRCGIVGSSRKLQGCLDLLAQAAGSEMNLLITGDTGTGKELFAHALHQNSSRVQGAYVIVDCAALPENLVESVLFGHVKGAFTGADQAREGLVAQANGGTLVLDEVGELPLGLQKDFLRFLETGAYRPVGSLKEHHSDFRLVSATNRNLEEMVAKGLFRNDLFFRLRTMQIHLPPLAQRREDIPELLGHHLPRICGRYGMETKGYTPGFLEALQYYQWPGNVREFINVLELAISRAEGFPTLYLQHLREDIRVFFSSANLGQEPAPGQPPTAPGPDSGGPPPPFQDYMERHTARLEESYLRDLLDRCGGDVKEAMTISGLGRTALYDRLRKHGIKIHS